MSWEIVGPHLEAHWIALSICMLLPLGLACATIWIQWRNWRIRGWQQTTGRIDSARSAAREIRSKRFRTTGSKPNTEFITSEEIRTRNFAEVSYSFAVGPTTYRGDRICLMGEPDGSTSDVLKRYPRGKIVTVHYNPEDPNESILERDDPARIREAWLGTAFLAALILGGFVVLTQGADWLRAVMTKPSRAPAVMFLAVFALFLLMFSRVFTKQARAMKKWPKTSGRVVRSAVVTTTERHTRPNRTSGNYDVTMYVPRIVYAYEVGGHSFESDDVGWSTSANKPSAAEKQVKRYPLQSPVTVFYNPEDPAQATLSPSMGMLPVILWIAAGGIAALAFAIGWLVP